MLCIIIRFKGCMKIIPASIWPEPTYVDWVTQLAKIVTVSQCTLLEIQDAHCISKLR